MKNLLGILGSPRKDGNTHVLISKILEGAKKEGALTEILFLNELRIQECDGCHSCWKGNDCSKNDDMNNLYLKIIENDILIFGTPVYWYGPTALMKAFIDRFVYFNCPENRIKLKDKKAILVIPFEENDVETAAPLLEMFEKSFAYLEIPIIEKIVVPGVTKRGEVINNIELIEQCIQIGKKIAY